LVPIITKSFLKNNHKTKDTKLSLNNVSNEIKHIIKYPKKEINSPTYACIAFERLWLKSQTFLKNKI
jgi:ribosomal protein S15P/S13E